MGPKKKRSSPWILILASLALLLTPASLSQKTQVTALAGFVPFQGLGRWASRLPGSAQAQELATKLAFMEDQNQRLLKENQRLSLQLEQALGMKQPVRDQNYRMIAADVLFPTDSSPWRKSLTIRLGTNHGSEKGLLVLY